MTRDDVVAALEARGAATIDHPGGTLLAHLIRTGALLEGWGASEALVLAGLGHAAYGTDGFPTALFSLDEREAVAGLIGDEAEAIVYRYGACDRQRTLGQLGRGPDVVWHDRFTAVAAPLSEREASELAELSVANELDIVAQGGPFATEHGPAIARLVAPWTAIISPAAAAACQTLLTVR